MLVFHLWRRRWRRRRGRFLSIYHRNWTLLLGYRVDVITSLLSVFATATIWILLSASFRSFDDDEDANDGGKMKPPQSGNKLMDNCSWRKNLNIHEKTTLKKRSTTTTATTTRPLTRTGGERDRWGLGRAPNADKIMRVQWFMGRAGSSHAGGGGTPWDWFRQEWAQLITSGVSSPV